MKQFMTVDKLEYFKGEEPVCLNFCGIIHSIKDMGSFSFLGLRLSDGIIQCVIESDTKKDGLKCEMPVEIIGEKRLDERSPHGFEIYIKDIKSLGSVKEESPVNIKKGKCGMNIETELNMRPIVLRNNYKRSIFKLREGIVTAFRLFLSEQGFTEIFSPKIVASGAEGGANIFKMDYFGKKAFLAQSPQFYKQTMIPVYERVYEIGPVFRAEKHDTARHLNEYISVDFEMGFIESFYDLTQMETEMLLFTFKFLKEKYSETLKTLGVSIPEFTEIPHVKFREAKEMVAAKYNRKIKDPFDLEPEEERLISELFKEEYDSDFVFVTHYPVKKRPFYAMDDPADGKYTLSFDLLFRGMEITTGGQRIHDYDMQVEKMKDKGLEPDDFESYLMLHKYGCPPHGGLGMGLERFVMKLIESTNIRETSMFPRDTGRITP